MTASSSGPHKWLASAPDPGAASRLFLIPYSGCGASMYRSWPDRDEGIDLCRLQPPGRENRFREPIPPTYEQLAASIVDAVDAYLDVPFAFFGHCGSALAAYEATAEIERRGGPTAANLFISSQVAPQDGPTGRWLTMDRSELDVELSKLIVAMGGTPVPELSDLYLDVLEEDIAVNKRYVVPEPQRLTAPITTIGWTEDIEVDHRLMGGWPACGTVRAVVLDGPHQRFLQAPRELFNLFVEGLSPDRVGSADDDGTHQQAASGQEATVEGVQH